MDKYFDNTPLVKVIFKWKWHIIIATVIAAILGAVFSGPKFITPMYKSVTVLYPSNVSSYSDETFTEQMLQIMESNDIMDSVIEKFNLIDHYKINKNDKYWKTYLMSEYHDNVSISKTKYDAVEVKVMDKDPQMACDIVNEIIHLYDKKVATLHKLKRKEAVDMFSYQLTTKTQYLDSLKRELNKITEDNDMLRYSYMSNDNSIAYFSNTGNNNGNISDAITLVELISSESSSYVDIKEAYESELRFYNSNMTFSNIISSPFVADKKDYPVRWVIVALCGIAAFSMSVLTVFAIEKNNVKE